MCSIEMHFYNLTSYLQGYTCATELRWQRILTGLASINYCRILAGHVFNVQGL